MSLASSPPLQRGRCAPRGEGICARRDQFGISSRADLGAFRRAVQPPARSCARLCATQGMSPASHDGIARTHAALSAAARGRRRRAPASSRWRIRLPASLRRAPESPAHPLVARITGTRIVLINRKPSSVFLLVRSDRVRLIVLSLEIALEIVTKHDDLVAVKGHNRFLGGGR